jgi:2-polyprenyl-6-methoxyphenol hydroxylase-like FAD-dependent oxidoreductase
MRVGIIGGSIAGCATAALLHRAGHDVTVFERSESDLVSRGAGIATPTAGWQDMMAHGLFDATLPACRADYFRFVTRGSGTGQQRWLGDVEMGFTLLNWGHLYQCIRRCVPDDLYRRASTVELAEARPQGTTLHLRPGGSLDFDLVVCADGYRSMGRRLIDPDAAPRYRGMVLWRGLLHESDIGVDALDGGNGQRVVYQGGHGVVYYLPGAEQSTERGKRLLMWGYYLQVPESALASVLVDDQERQQSRWPTPPHWRMPSPAPRPLMMVCADGVRLRSRPLLRSCRSRNGSSGAPCSTCLTSPPCQPQRPTTGCPQPIPGSWSRFPACDREERLTGGA